MSFRLKFFITIIGLLTIIGAAIPLLSKSSQYITIKQFNNDRNSHHNHNKSKSCRHSEVLISVLLDVFLITQASVIWL